MWLPFFSGQLGKLSCISPTPTVMGEGGRGRFELGGVPDTFWVLQLLKKIPILIGTVRFSLSILQMVHGIVLTLWQYSL